MSFSLCAALKKKSSSPLYRLIGIVVVAVIILLVWLWWHFVYANPSNVFHGMIERSLSTTSFTKDVTQNSDGQYLYQYSVIETGAVNRSESITKVDTPSEETYVTTKSIGTPISDYEEYTHISTGVKPSKNSTLKFGPAIGVWGASLGSKTTDGQLFNSTVLGYVPIGNLSDAQKAKLINLINKDHVYEFSTDVKKKTVGGRPRYTYTVALNPVAYVQMLKMFGTDIGLNQLANVSDQSLGTEPIPFKFTIDVLSRQLVSITGAGSNRVETYSGYGIKLPIAIPKKTVPIGQLEDLLQSLN